MVWLFHYVPDLILHALFFPLTGMFKAFKYSRAECSRALMRLNVKVLFTEENTALWDKCVCTLWLLSHKSHGWQWLREGNWMYVNTNTHTFQSGSCAHLPSRDNETQTDERKAETNGHEKDEINLVGIAHQRSRTHTSVNVCACIKKGENACCMKLVGRERENDSEGVGRENERGKKKKAQRILWRERLL